MIVRATRHGPVMSDIDGEMMRLAGPRQGDGAGLHRPRRDRYDDGGVLAAENQARGQNDVLHALKMYQAPPQNIVYADREGHIGFINPGLLPIRKAGDGRMPADGASGAFDWTGMASFEQMPQVRDPKPASSSTPTAPSSRGNSRLASARIGESRSAPGEFRTS